MRKALYTRPRPPAAGIVSVSTSSLIPLGDGDGGVDVMVMAPWRCFGDEDISLYHIDVDVGSGKAIRRISRRIPGSDDRGGCYGILCA